MPRAIVLAAFAGVLVASAARAEGARVVLDAPGAPREPATLADVARPPIRVFRDRDGLPENAVMSIARDRDGRLWVATQDGAASFDGALWTTLNMPRREVSNFVRAVHVDGAGALWFGRQDGGLARFERGAWTTFDTTSGLPSARVNAIAEAGGALWVATEAGVARRDGAGFRVFAAAQGLPDPVGALLEAVDDNGQPALYAGTARGLRVLRGDRFEPVPGAPEHEVTALLATRGPILWVATTHGLWRREAGAWRVVDASSGLPSSDVSALAETTAEDGSRTLWVGTDGGVARLEDGRWIPFPTDGLLSSPSIWSFLAVPENGPTQTLWIGADGGLARVRFGGWQSFAMPVESSSVFATLVTRDEQGRDVLWLGTRGSGLLRFADGAWARIDDKDGLPSPTVYSLAETEDGLWVGTVRGLARLAHGAVDGTTYLPHVGVRQLVVAGGALYAATGKAGVHRFERGAWSEIEGLPTKQTYGVFADGDELWVATEGAGVARRVGGAWTIYDRASGALANDSALSVHVHHGAHRTAWVGTEGGGVSVLDLDAPRGARFVTYNESTTPAIPNDTVYQIREDARGRLYLFTNKGVGRLTLRDGDTPFEVETFTTEDGLPSNEFDGSAAFVDARGRIWGGTLGGAAYFDPSREVEAPPPPLVFARATPAGAELSHDASNAEFAWGLVALFRGDDARYRTQLVGLEDAPSPWSGDRKRAFTKLPEGAYAFRVWGRDHRGRVVGPLEVPFRVRAAPWRTWWAWALYATLAGAIAWGVVRYRVYALERRNRTLAARVEERTRELAAKVEELAASEQRARAAEEDARRANRAKSAFLSTMSHELRTPLNAILGFSQLVARDRRLPADHKENVDVIQKSGEHLLGMINDVLSIAKIEAGELALDARAFDLDEAVRAAARMVEGRARTKKLALRVDVARVEGVRVRGDEGRLRQILLNLLANAVKFTESGGVTVRAAWADGRARIEVADTGPGIAKADLDRLFAPFAQTEAGARATEGTGLGLAISRSLARRMGGDVRAESEVGVGTTFVVEIDLPPADDAPPSSAERAPVALAPGSGPLRVLVADDTPENRRLLAKILARVGGFEVREAARGDEAVALWGSFRPHAVFMDFRMEGLDGAAATRAIRAREREGHTAIVALSASAFEHDRDALLAAGCDAFVPKPYAPEAIFDALERFCGARFVYDGERAPPSMASSSVMTRARLSKLPAELRASLRRAASSGDLRAARAAVAAVEPVDADLSRALRQLVDAFRLEEIEAKVEIDDGDRGEERA